MLSKLPRLAFPLAQIGFLVVFVIMGYLISLNTPLARVRDELANFHFVRFVAKYGRLPITWPERGEADYKSEWPPLFYMLVGMAGQNINLDLPPFIKMAQNNPRVQLVFGPDHIKSGWASRAIKTEDPYQGEILLWYMGRWGALLFSVLGIVFTYLLVRAIHSVTPWLALGAAACLAFTPKYIWMSSVICYEPLLTIPLALYFLLLFYTFQKPDRSWPYLGLGLLLGVGGLVKYTPMPAALIVPLLMIWFARRQHWTWFVMGWRLALFGMGLVVTFGSWLVYSEICFNQVKEAGWSAGLLYPFFASNVTVSDEPSLRMAGFLTGGKLGGIDQSLGNETLWQWVWVLLRDIYGQTWQAWIFLGLLALAILGLARRWRDMDELTRLWTVSLLAHLILFIVLVVMRFLLTGRANLYTADGQHVIFVAGTVILLLFIQGLSAWLSPTRLTALFLVITGIFLWQNVVSVAKLNDPAWPIQTVPLSDNEQILAAFDNISLIDYESAANGQNLDITLYWRDEALLDKDYQEELTLWDASGRLQTRWLGQPLNGQYPTRAWTPKDRIRDLIQIPLVGLGPGEYQLQLRWLGEAGPLSPVKLNQQVSVTTKADGLDLGRLKLTADPTPPIFQTVRFNGQEFGYTVWFQGQPPAEIPSYQERSTIVLVTRERLGEEIRLSLVGPDRRPRLPVEHTGHIYIFSVEPHFARGEYQVRFEQWSGANLVAQMETPTLLFIHTQQRQFEIGPISHPVSANFADQVVLLGYDLPQRHVQTGDKLLVTLHWQALKNIGADLIIFNHLINTRQEIWGGQDRQPRAVYSTMLWAPGEIVTDPFIIQVDPQAPAGIYNLLVGLYLPVGQAAVSLPLVEDGRLTNITSVSIGPVKIGPTSPGLIRASVKPQVSLKQPFGDTPNLTLLGYDLTDMSGQPLSSLNSASVKLTLYWRAESLLPLDYTTFVHLRNAAGETVAQKDQPPLQGAYPTSLWDAGEIVADEIVVPLSAPLPAGAYKLVVGMYDFNTGQRLIVPGNPANEVTLTHVDIP